MCYFEMLIFYYSRFKNCYFCSAEALKGAEKKLLQLLKTEVVTGLMSRQAQWSWLKFLFIQRVWRLPLKQSSNTPGTMMMEW